MKTILLSSFLLLSFNSGLPFMKFNDNPVVAHRGAWKKNQLPENSMASLRQAIQLKCLGSEFDVRMTLDDSLVINHDPHFQGLDVEKSTFEQLSKYKLTNGEALPTLAQYLKYGMEDNTGTQLVMELKPSFSQKGKQIAYQVVNLVKAMNAESWVSYISFDLNILTAILELNPDADTQYLNGDQSPDHLKKLGINGLDYQYMVFKKNPQWITEAKANAQKLNAWTVNDSVDLKWFLERQFDAITTNEPELLFEILAGKH